MSSAATLQSGPVRRAARLFQPQGFAWLLFVAVLIATAPETNYDAFILLPIIGAFQIVEPRLKLFSSRRGQIISIILKLILSYLLIGFSDGAESYYYPIFLIPVVSAATLFELPGVILVTAVASLAYFSFLLPGFYNYNLYQLPPHHISVMSLRVSFYAIVAFLVYHQAKAKREEMKRTEQAAERLAESNRSLRAAEASLRRSERLAALGQLTAGLAHELRNPLGTIKASAEMLTRASTKDRPEVMSEMTGYIVSEVDRVNGLIASFLDFARPLQIRAVTADLRSTLDDVVRQQSDSARVSNVELALRMNDGPLSFEFDPDLLKLAVSNLVQNAIQASAAGQRVEIRAENRNGNVIILVSDHGQGIQPDHLESIFNPFFTTKPQGTGLGLAIVSKIVDEHEGRINVFSEPGNGTTFEVTLPKEQHRSTR
ncbi:MAG: ATP-binding protein [Acidobacteriaceae bacterium]|nr:ATP-binding protein [Acidobacteriaceae bacterium]MBV9779076.1 ATP-binding protein [Acidobacteriaceae bacterium]